MNPILDEIAKTSIQLMLNEPFYGHFFSTIVKDVSEETDTIAFAPSRREMLKLLVNPKYWNAQGTSEEALKRHSDSGDAQNPTAQPETPELPGLKGKTDEETRNLRYGAIKHQILHLVLKHILRAHEFSNKKLFNIASDLSVNQYIKDDQLVQDSVRLEQFPDFNLERQQSVDYYYRKLYEEADKCSKCSGDGDEESEEGDGQGEGGEGLNESQKNLLGLLNNPNRQLDQHKFWDDIQKMSSAERKILDSAINNAIMGTLDRLRGKSRGTLPAGLEQYINMLLESLKPNVNWRRVLRLFAASSSQTRLKNTIRKPSKRYGTTPGIKIQRKQKLLVALDTSGSVGDDEIKEFFGELHHIWKQGPVILVGGVPL